MASLLGPLWNHQFETHRIEFTDLPTGRSQSLSYGDFGTIDATVSVIGPAMWPRSIRLTEDSSQINQDVHDFDLRNVYVLSRHWECGSCPHLFLEGFGGELTYLGEVFARGPEGSQDCALVAPNGAAALWLAELEEETTFVESVNINGRRLHKHLRMSKGDTLRIVVRPGDNCVFRGYYHSPVNHPIEPWTRNCIVGDFINKINRGKRSSPFAS